jgi:predicted Na+-dependent transporter
MLRVVYGDRSQHDLAVLMLPLITYHLLELVSGLVLSSRIKAWVTQQNSQRVEELAATTVEQVV